MGMQAGVTPPARTGVRHVRKKKRRICLREEIENDLQIHLALKHRWAFRRSREEISVVSTLGTSAVWSLRVNCFCQLRTAMNWLSGKTMNRCRTVGNDEELST